MPRRNVTGEDFDPRERFALYRLCDCPTCDGKGKARSHLGNIFEDFYWKEIKCHACRGEGRIRQEVATCETSEAVGVALVTLAREGEFEECPIGLLDRTPECEECEGAKRIDWRNGQRVAPYPCPECKGSGVKPTGTWLIRPWLPSARNVSDAGRVLAKSKKTSS